MELVANIFRTKRSDQGTEGILSVGEFHCFVMELPWRNNQPNVSCIPTGTYEAIIRHSPHFGKVYHVLHVAGRSYILIHSGNWGGDVSKGFRTHTNGCILLGIRRGWLVGQRAVLGSRIALRRFMKHMDDESFKLQIMEAF